MPFYVISFNYSARITKHSLNQNTNIEINDNLWMCVEQIMHSNMKFFNALCILRPI